MVIAVSGRRPDSHNSQEVRFPEANIDVVRQRLTAKLVEHAPTAVVCSAACGTDLIVLDVARELAIRTVVVLPWSVNRFRETSVDDCGNDWSHLYKRSMSSVDPTDVRVL